MKRKFTPIKFILVIALSIAATISSSAQTILYNETFNSDSTALPLGWTTTGNAWHVETSNPSAAYIGASGLVNVAIRNDSATGIYSLISKSISTVGYNSINAIWGARLTTNFPTNGSAVTGFYWSSDNGSTWNTLTYTENSNNSVWSLDNANAPIALPAAANNQPSVMFKWTVSIVNGSQGTYRIDDFTVGGIVNVGIGESPLLISSAELFPNPSNNETKLILHARVNLKASVEIFDILGQQTGILSEVIVTAGSSTILLDEKLFPSNGLYFIRIKTGDEIQTLRFIKN